jgi:hypothetical protein
VKADISLIQSTDLVYLSCVQYVVHCQRTIDHNVYSVELFYRKEVCCIQCEPVFQNSFALNRIFSYFGPGQLYLYKIFSCIFQDVFTSYKVFGCFFPRFVVFYKIFSGFVQAMFTVYGMFGFVQDWKSLFAIFGCLHRIGLLYAE